jgi:hypothetical protein
VEDGTTKASPLRVASSVGRALWVKTALELFAVPWSFLYRLNKKTQADRIKPLGARAEENEGECKKEAARRKAGGWEWRILRKKL